MPKTKGLTLNAQHLTTRRLTKLTIRIPCNTSNFTFGKMKKTPNDFL